MNRARWHLPVLSLCLSGLLLLLTPLGTSAQSPVGAAPTKARAWLPVVGTPPQPAQPPPGLAWLEPQGLPIAALVGQVPDDQLRGAIVSYGPGLALYASGAVVGNDLVIRARLFGRDRSEPNGPARTMVGCLAHPVFDDNLGSVALASSLRLRTPEGKDVTDQVIALQTLNAAVAPPKQATGAKYEWQGAAPQIDTSGLRLPLSRGCQILVAGDYPELLGSFTLPRGPRPSAQVLSAQNETFFSQIGPVAESWGRFASLARQLLGHYGVRGGFFSLQAPAAANYVLAIYAPQPADPYDAAPANAARPTAATWRLARLGTTPPDFRSDLSVDLTSSGPIPLRAVWQDTDQAPGTVYLPSIPNVDTFTIPELNRAARRGL